MTNVAQKITYKIRNDIVEKIVYYCEKYIYDRKFPDKAIDILDEVCSKVSTSNTKKYKEYEKDTQINWQSRHWCNNWIDTGISAVPRFYDSRAQGGTCPVSDDNCNLVDHVARCACVADCVGSPDGCVHVRNRSDRAGDSRLSPQGVSQSPVPMDEGLQYREHLPVSGGDGLADGALFRMPGRRVLFVRFPCAFQLRCRRRMAWQTQAKTA